MLARNKTAATAALLALAAFSVYLGLTWGAATDLDRFLIRELRLPRVVLAFAIGAGLSVSGAALQALFANPLCEPYTLGISSGATLGAVVSATLGFSFTAFGVAPLSLPGALAMTLVLLLLSTRSRLSQSAILLSGVMLGFLGSSLVALWMATADPSGIQGALLWLLGDLSRARIEGALLTFAGVLFLSAVLLQYHAQLDALLMGEDEARAMGVSILRMRVLVIGATSVIVAFCVSSAGIIGFIGLLIPHVVRAIFGARHRDVIPLSFVAGGAALILSDLMARVLLRPYELPVGVVTALIGAPLFVFILARRPRGGRSGAAASGGGA